MRELTIKLFKEIMRFTISKIRIFENQFLNEIDATFFVYFYMYFYNLLLIIYLYSIGN